MAEGFSCFKPGCTVQINEGDCQHIRVDGCDERSPSTDPENKNAEDNPLSVFGLVCAAVRNLQKKTSAVAV